MAGSSKFVKIDGVGANQSDDSSSPSKNSATASRIFASSSWKVSACVTIGIFTPSAVYVPFSHETLIWMIPLMRKVYFERPACIGHNGIERPERSPLHRGVSVVRFPDMIKVAEKIDMAPVAFTSDLTAMADYLRALKAAKPSSAACLTSNRVGVSKARRHSPMN